MSDVRKAKRPRWRRGRCEGWYARLDPEIVCGIDSDKFPPMLMEVVW